MPYLVAESRQGASVKAFEVDYLKYSAAPEKPERNALDADRGDHQMILRRR